MENKFNQEDDINILVFAITTDIDEKEKIDKANKQSSKSDNKKHTNLSDKIFNYIHITKYK